MKTEKQTDFCENAIDAAIHTDSFVVYNDEEMSSEATDVSHTTYCSNDVADFDRRHRVLRIYGEVDESSLDVIEAIIRYNIEDKGIEEPLRVPIKIFINTLGGDASVMWSIISAIQCSKTPVFTIAIHNAQSAGAEILAAGHYRAALPGAKIMIHTGDCNYSGSRENVMSMYEHYEEHQRRIVKYFLSRTNITEEEYFKRAPFNWYMFADEALEHGIIDSVLRDIEEVF